MAADADIAEFQVSAPSRETAAGNLSGGNAQRVVLARELRLATKVLLANQPTRGLDVGVIEYIHTRILKKRAEGVAVLIASTVMMNYIIVYLLSYLLAGGPWTGAGTTAYHQTQVLDGNFQLPVMASSAKLHIGFLIALLSTVICYLVIEKTPLGFELRALGYNPNALRLKGINVGRTVLLVMFISGGLAALAGVSEIFGVNHRLRGDVMT